MCTAGLGEGFAAASSLLPIYTQNAQQSAQASMQEYESQVAANNQNVALQQAQNAENQGQLALQQQQITNANVIGNDRARMAANGIDLSMGSPIDVLNSATNLGDLDATSIRNNTINQAYGYDAQAMNQSAASQLDQYKANLTSWNQQMGLANMIAPSITSNISSFVGGDENGGGGSGDGAGVTSFLADLA